MVGNHVTTEQHEVIEEFYDCMYSDRDLASKWDEYATRYDYINALIGYDGPIPVAAEIAKCFDESEIASKLILDVGSGTGSVGAHMAAKGFKQIHALDISTVSLEEARKKNAYQHFICALVTKEPIPDISKDTYDAVVSSGCVTPHCIEMEGLEELARITKPGGFLVFTIHDPYFKMDYMEALGRFMGEKMVELISMKLIPYKRDYKKDYEIAYGHLVVLQVL